MTLSERFENSFWSKYCVEVSSNVHFSTYELPTQPKLRVRLLRRLDRLPHRLDRSFIFNQNEFSNSSESVKNELLVEFYVGVGTAGCF